MDFECQECGAEFDLISDDSMIPKYCPYCGETMEYDEEPEMEQEDWED